MHLIVRGPCRWRIGESPGFTMSSGGGIASATLGSLAATGMAHQPYLRRACCGCRILCCAWSVGFAGCGVDLTGLEDEFVWLAKGYADRKGISYKAFREVVSQPQS